MQLWFQKAAESGEVGPKKPACWFTNRTIQSTPEINIHLINVWNLSNLIYHQSSWLKFAGEQAVGIMGIGDVELAVGIGGGGDVESYCGAVVVMTETMGRKEI